MQCSSIVVRLLLTRGGVCVLQIGFEFHEITMLSAETVNVFHRTETFLWLMRLYVDFYQEIFDNKTQVVS
ncbi:hypothetical protein LOK49_LG02G02518 [Camellia lanceoleosa]|uniref:Uncharacterized protein n=1 Tax=Camellia lanceoleosa TaxID=1840588 RepID=A0ACC0IR50_9ERIC|nr:hypothetical protein LOK49_LG02G02518 [Camellia lanceoleosa]